MMIKVYERGLKEPLIKLDFHAWAVINNMGKISVEKKDCYSSTDEMLRKLAVIKISGQEAGHDLLGFSYHDFCSQLFLDVNRHFDTCFVHSDKELLIQGWNNKVNALKIPKDKKVYLYDNDINNIFELLKFIKDNIKVNFDEDEIIIKTKKDNIEISLRLDNESVSKGLKEDDEIEFYVSEDSVPNFSPYLSDEYWDEGIEGTVSIRRLNDYILDFGGLDLVLTVVDIYELKSEEEMGANINNSNSDMVNNFLALDAFFGGAYNTKKHLLLPILTDSDERYVYELLNRNTIIAYKIMGEDKDFWYTKEKKFAKFDINKVNQFNPYKFSDMYSDNLDKLIDTFNDNLTTFLI